MIEFTRTDTGMGTSYSVVLTKDGKELGRVGVSPGNHAHSALAFARYKRAQLHYKLPWKVHYYLRRLLT